MSTDAKRWERLWHIAFGALALCMLVFLLVRASDEYRWSDWGFGDAQTMLSIRHWNEKGWLANKFLCIAQGYAKVVRLLDEPNLRHHAHGISPLSAPGIGPRLWYTHYPSGYLVPYALLSKFGFNDIFSMRMLSIIFSVCAIALMYILFSKITSPAVSFVAVLFYIFTPAFLGYADSFASQPLDDFLRFAFMLGTVLSTRATSSKQRKLWMISTWIIGFLVALASYDYVFFVYLWLIGWDLLERRGFRWKVYFVYALAPLAAYCLQFFQNVWYLGFDDAVKDIRVTFLQKSGSLKVYNRFFIIFFTFLPSIYKPYERSNLLILLLIFYIVYIRFLRDKNQKGLPSLGLLAVLSFCGLAFGFVLPFQLSWEYQIRQIAPFTSILISAMTWSFLMEISRSVYWKNSYRKNLEPLLRKSIRVLYIILSASVLFIFWYNFVLLDRRPRYDIRENNPQIYFDILLAKEIKSLPTKYESVIFSVGGFDEFLCPTYIPGYPQIHPITEYYSSKPILCFTTPERLAADLIYMVNHSPYKFSPVLVTKDPLNIEKVLFNLKEEGMLKTGQGQTHSFMGRYILDLTERLKWN